MPIDSNQKVTSALNHLKQGEIESAKNLLQSMLAAAEIVQDLYYVLALCELSLQNHQAARLCLEKEVENFPTNSSAATLLQELIAESAITSTSASLDICDPNSFSQAPPALSPLITLHAQLMQESRWQDAIQVSNKIIEVAPNQRVVNLHSQRALCYCKLGEYFMALSEYNAENLLADSRSAAAAKSAILTLSKALAFRTPLEIPPDLGGKTPK